MKQKVGYKNNYMYVTLHQNGNAKTHLVHRLVANTFICNCNNYPQVNHIDGNKHNNNITNLEWVTAKENTRHSFNIGLNKISKRVKQFDLNGKYIKTWNRMMDIERQLNISHQQICRCCQNKLHKTHGYIWRYADGE